MDINISVPKIYHSFILPDFPATTKWLTIQEREYAMRRLEHDNNSTLAGDLSHIQSFIHAVKDWRYASYNTISILR